MLNTVEGPRKIGNLELYEFTAHHAREYWPAVQRPLLDAIDRFKLIIPEYYPPEYQYVKNSFSVLGSMIKDLDEDNNGVFDELAKVLIKKEKDVCVVDPAYNEKLIVARGLEHLFVAKKFAELFVVGTAIGYGAYKEMEDHKFSRKQFMKGVLVGAGSLVAAAAALQIGMLPVGAVIGPDRVPGVSPYLAWIENNFRENIIAQNLVDLGEKVEPGTKALLIYPPQHMNGINAYLNDPAKRVEVYKWYSRLKHIDFFNQLFQIRHYPNGVV